MKKSTVVFLSFLFFAMVNGITGYYCYIHPELTHNFDVSFLIDNFNPHDIGTWIGWALCTGPAIAWLLFVLFVAMIPDRDIHIKAKEQIGATGSGPENDRESEQIEDNRSIRDAEGKIEEADDEAKADVSEEMEERAVADGLYPKEIAIVQLLGLLQREGRLIDFLEEDIEPYDDAQIGAAVREVHRGCRQAIKDALALKPVLDAPEGSEVEIDEDFDPTKIRLIGNVHGEPPFKGIIRHCGWRFTKIDLPDWTGKEKTDVLAPAEVEIL